MTNPTTEEIKSAVDYWKGRLRGMETDTGAVDIVAVKELRILLDFAQLNALYEGEESICNSCLEVCKATHYRQSCELYNPKG